MALGYDAIYAQWVDTDESHKGAVVFLLSFSLPLVYSLAWVRYISPVSTIDMLLYDVFYQVLLIICS